MEAVPGTVAAHGGKYLVRAGNTEVAEGDLGEYPLKVILEFPSMPRQKAGTTLANIRQSSRIARKNSK